LDVPDQPSVPLIVVHDDNEHHRPKIPANYRLRTLAAFVRAAADDALGPI